MPKTISGTELLNDCRLLFGSDITNITSFLQNMAPSELKMVYRRKAFETHPDRAKILGRLESEMMTHFKEVVLAYERLNLFIQRQSMKGLIIGDTATKQKKDTQKTVWNTAPDKKQNITTEHFYKGEIPKRKLLIGQYLYYSGIISWRTLLSAIFWQRRQRPLIGQLAREWKILTTEDIRKILTTRNYREKFAEYACRNGFITHFQYLALMGRQRMLQRPFGEFFLQQNILSAKELDELIKRQRAWNREVVKMINPMECVFW
ncbi:MAG: J domain-containing protein [Candidatus Kuenenia sp.]|nr:J domain-containing protein [Candidatus Kuenenia hertensis]